MTVCQSGVPCVWGRRDANTVVCSLPRCVLSQLRTGYLDRLAGGWIKYGVFQKEVEHIGVGVPSGSLSSPDTDTSDSRVITHSS